MSETLPKTHKGKVGRLPAKIREEVCRRIHDGQTAGQILPWLNGLEEVKRVCEVHFDGEEITPQNLSAWRMGGFNVWLKQQDDIQATRDRAVQSLELAKAAGGNLSEGIIAQLTGEVMEILTDIDSLKDEDGKVDTKALGNLNKMLTGARLRELQTQTHQLQLRKLEQRDRELDLAEDEFQLQFVETFIKHLDDAKAREIAASGERKDVKMEQLRMHLFGKRPERVAGEVTA